MNRLFFSILVFGCACSGETGPVMIPSSATLPNCDQEPATDLTGDWFDNGTVTIESDGCPDVQVDDMIGVCGLDWKFEQTGNDVTITVDNEYEIDARFCEDTLHLKGGWWLPVRDDGMCNYEDDSADEVAIQSGGNTLSFEDNQLAGTLAIKGRCSASLEMTLERKTF